MPGKKFCMKRKTSLEKKINKLPQDELLPLLCAAAAIRNYDLLRTVLKALKDINVKRTYVYESLLQNYLFTGYPSALVSLKIMSEFYTESETEKLEGWDLNKYRERGVKNCKRIYGRKFNKLISNIQSFSPELSDWLVLEGYGKVLGRKSLPMKQRELNIIAVLTVQQFEEQLYSHINGAFRLKINSGKIRKVITNLKNINGDNYSKFGLKVLRRYLRKKGAE